MFKKKLIGLKDNFGVRPEISHNESNLFYKSSIYWVFSLINNSFNLLVKLQSKDNKNIKVQLVFWKEHKARIG